MTLAAIMKNFTILILLFLFSCKTLNPAKDILDTEHSEILNYKLEKIDTLVDIGCGQGSFSKEISHLYPNLFFILEDLPKLSVFVKKGDTTNCKKVDTRTEIKNRLRNNKYTPKLENKYSLIIGSDDSIPILTGTCKRVLCRKTLHEFKNKIKMSSELSRILSSDGVLTIVEKEPKYFGEKDIFCLNNYLSRQEIINILRPLKLQSATSVIYKYEGEQKFNIYNFIK